MNTTSRTAPVSFTIPPNGNVGQHKDKELRGFAHTDKTPTGLYVDKDDVITLNVDRDGLELNIGQWGAYAHLNGGEDIGFTAFALSAGSNTVTFTKGTGMIYFINRTEDETFTVSIDGARQAPVFCVDQTTQAEWLAQLDSLPDAPFGELIGQHTVATYQLELLNTPKARALNINNALRNWDEVYRLHNQTHGLIEGGTGVATKYANRIHYTTPDEGGGYAYATAYRIAFQKNTGAGAEILENSAKDDKPGTWTVFHEAGHTYQNQLYKPSYGGEVTVNIYANIAQEKLGLGSRFEGNTGMRTAIQAYLESSEADKNFADPQPATDSPKYPFSNDTQLWVRLGMYLQLHYGYGEHFYPHLNQQYRILIDPDISGDEIKLQHFVLHASLVAGRNLTPFFTRWGIYPQADIIEQIRHLPEPTAPIWDNIWGDNVIVDLQLPAYQPPSARVISAPYTIGEPLTDGDLDRFVADIQVAAPPRRTEWVTDNNVAKNTTLSVIVRDAENNQNRFQIPIQFSYGNAVTFTNYTYKKERLILTLQAQTQTLEMFYDRKDSTNLESGPEKFAELHFYAASGESGQIFSVSGNTDGVDFAHQISGTPYVNGQLLKVTTHTRRRMAAYQENMPILPLEDANAVEYFRLQDDRFHLLTAEDVMPQATPVATSTDIGVEVAADNLLKDIKILFGTTPTIEFVTQPNVYLPGQSTLSVRVTDEAGNSATFDVPLTVRYNTAISMTAYGSEERAVLRINARQKIIEAFSNPSLNTVINSGSGKYYEIVQYSVDLAEKARFSVNREEKPFDFVAAINGTAYEEEDYLHVHVADRQKITAYVMNNQLFPREESTTDEWFRVAFGELKRVPSPL